jgi:hypothetical protein
MSLTHLHHGFISVDLQGIKLQIMYVICEFFEIRAHPIDRFDDSSLTDMTSLKIV